MPYNNSILKPKTNNHTESKTTDELGFAINLSDNNISFYHLGPIDFMIINELLNRIKQELNDLKTDYALRKKIYNTSVECLENIVKHGFKADTSDCLFYAGVENNVFFIYAGNPITVKNHQKLKKKLEGLKLFDRRQLKDHYIHLMSSSIIDKSGPVELGILDMAIKANNRLKYDFSKSPNNKIFFTLQVQIKLD